MLIFIKGMDTNTENESFEKFESPNYFKKKYPVSKEALETITKARVDIKNILDRKDSRRIFIIGPCSIHNYDEALIYADKLKILSDKVKDKFLILMRVYLEKPRTSRGWKGFVNDPDLNSKYNINKGIELSRKLLLKINEIGLPVTTEFLDILVYPYIYDLISWGAIGARTTEDQTHRQMVSGFSIPIGYKNSTSGNIDVAIHSIKTSEIPHHFLGINGDGVVNKISTKGNKYCHLILRGGDSGPNYEEDFIKEVEERLEEKEVPKNIMIDCSHGNSLKDYKRQPEVFKEVVMQMTSNENIIGLMLESYLEEGVQEIPKDLKKLKPGVSITDGCINWDTTEKIVMTAYDVL